MMIYSSGNAGTHCLICGKPFKPYYYITSNTVGNDLMYCVGNHYQRCEQCGWNVIDVHHTVAECKRLQEIGHVANEITQYILERNNPPQHVNCHCDIEPRHDTAIPAAFYDAFKDGDLQP